MPYKETKLKSGKIKITSPHGVKSKGSTPENAQKQLNLLRAVEHGWHPTKNKFASRMAAGYIALAMILTSWLVPMTADAFPNDCWATTGSDER